MPIDTLVFCTMVYDWYYMGCNNNTILTPIIAAQCKDPVIIQLVNKYKTEIDIRIKQIVKIVVPPLGDGGGDGNDTGNGNDTNGGNNTMPIDTCMGGPPGIDGCPPEDGRNKTTTLLPIISPPIDPCIENPNAEGCPPPTCPPGQHYDSATGKCVDDSPPIDPCIENPNAEGCEPTPPPPIDPCEEDPTAEGCAPPPEQDEEVGEEEEVEEEEAEADEEEAGAEEEAEEEDDEESEPEEDTTEDADEEE
jgi:hypothetical protein